MRNIIICQGSNFFLKSNEHVRRDRKNYFKTPTVKDIIDLFREKNTTKSSEQPFRHFRHMYPNYISYLPIQWMTNISLRDFYKPPLITLSYPTPIRYIPFMMLMDGNQTNVGSSPGRIRHLQSPRCPIHRVISPSPYLYF